MAVRPTGIPFLRMIYSICNVREKPSFFSIFSLSVGHAVAFLPISPLIEINIPVCYTFL